jgi:hypothetical protein
MIQLLSHPLALPILDLHLFDVGGHCAYFIEDRAEYLHGMGD